NPGAVPFELPVQGNDMENVFYLRGREWADAVKKAMPEAKQAVVIGGVYIGIEAAQSFTRAFIKTTVIDTQDSIIPTNIDKEFKNILGGTASEHGMTFQPNQILQEITGEDNQASKVVTDKAAYKADMGLIAAGVRPNTSWLDGIINLDDHGLIEIDDYLQTSDSNIY